MSFPKSKRFENIKSSAPAPGSYDPKLLDHTPGVSIQTSERFKISKDDMNLPLKASSESSLEAINYLISPRKTLFKQPVLSVPSSAKAKKEVKKKEDVASHGRVKDLEKELRSLVSERVDIDKRLAGRESEVVRLEARLQQVHKDKSALTARVATLERNVASVTKSNETLKHQMSSNDNVQSKAKCLQQELTSLHMEAEKHTREAKRLREQLEKARNEAETAMQKSKGKFTNLQEECKTLEQQQKATQQEIEKLKKEIERLKCDKRAVEKERDAIRAELEAVRRAHEEQLSTEQQDLIGRITALSEKEEALSTSVQTLTDRNLHLEQQLAEKSSVAEVRDAIRVELEAAQREHEAEVEALRRTMEGRVAALTEREAVLNTTVHALEGQARQLQENLDEKRTVEGERDAIHTELAETQAKHDEQLEMVKRDMETRLAALVEEETTLNATLHALTTKSKHLEKSLAGRGAVEEERDALRAELEAAWRVEQGRAGSIATLSAQEATLNSNIAALTTKYGQLEENLECVQKEHEVKEGQLKREVAALRTSLLELQSANDMLSCVNTDLMGRLTQQQEEVDLLEKKLMEAESITNEKFELLTNYLDSKTAEIDQLKQQLAARTAEVAAGSEVQAARWSAEQEVASLTKALEQRSLEEQDMRWQLEKAMGQVVENQELVETRQEELRTMRHLQEESERETNEEMEVIRGHMERLQADHRAEVEQYRRRLDHVTSTVSVQQDEMQKCSAAAEADLLKQISKLEENMSAAEMASLHEIEGLKLQLDEKEESNQRELKRMRIDMEGCEAAAAREVSDLKEQLDESEQSANKSIESLVHRLAEFRLQNNEVIGELKEQVREGRRERAILEESHRRAVEAEKMDKRQRVSEQVTLKVDMEKLRQELDAERAANACTVRLLEEERDQGLEVLEERNACIANLHEQLEDAKNLLSNNMLTLEQELRKNTSQMEALHRQIEDAEEAAMRSEKAAAEEVQEIREEMVRVEQVAGEQIEQFEEQVRAVQQESHKEVSEVTHLLEDMRQQYDAEVTNLSVRLQVRDEEIARLNSHLNNTQQVANSVKEKCTVLKAELIRLTEEHKAEREQMKKRSEEAKALVEQEQVAALGRMRDDHWEAVTRLQEEHEAELERRNTEHGAHHHLDIQQMIQAHQELQEKYDALEQLVGPFQEQLSAFEADRLALLGSKTHAEQEIDKLSDEYAKLLGHQNQKQKIKHVLKLKHENNRLKHDLATAQEELLKLHRQFSRLEEKTRPAGDAGKRRFDTTKAFQHAKENQTPPVSPLRPGNRI